MRLEARAGDHYTRRLLRCALGSWLAHHDNVLDRAHILRLRCVSRLATAALRHWHARAKREGAASSAKRRRAHLHARRALLRSAWAQMKDGVEYHRNNRMVMAEKEDMWKKVRGWLK